MRERPILFRPEMVRALLSDAKTQTRRVVKPQPRDPYTGLDLRPGSSPVDLPRCPHGAPGDRLWVRETWGLLDTEPRDGPTRATVFHRATDGERPDLRYQLWRPSIFMPRWASRIDLEVTGVRVERLQEISEADARAEGIREGHHDVPAAMGGGVRTWDIGGDEWWTDPVAAFRALWVDINGAGSWSANPWVWVISFRRVRP